MAEKEYIERGAMLRTIEELNDGENWMVNQYNADWIYSFIDNAPTADVVEVVHGKWLDRPKDNYCDGESPFVVGMVDGVPYASCYCSECGEWLVASDEYPVMGKYCPNCGAKMDGKGDKR